jgi:LPS export ABC transporter permease LptG/LPS export ABC transporter permease LptF
MRLLSRAIFLEVAGSAGLGTVLFTFVLFLQNLGSGKLFETLVRGSAPPTTVAYMFGLVLPPALIFALPVGTLVGVLIGLSRMSADGEITAMRACGIPSRRVIVPVVSFALLATAACALSSLWLTPLAVRETYRVLNSVIAQQLTAEVRPRVFEEQFTSANTVLYVGDQRATANSAVIWRNVFIADLTPPEQRSGGGREYGDAPGITVAAEAVAVPDAARNLIQLSMTGCYTYDVGKDPIHDYNTSAPHCDQKLVARPRASADVKPYVAMDTASLIGEARQSLDADIQLQRRFALPPACLLLALVGIPLGVSSRKSGKSAAFALTVFLAFLYYMGLVSLIGMAETGKLPVWIAVWTPNAVFGVAGLLLMTGLERAGDRDILSRVRRVGSRGWQALRSLLPASTPGASIASPLPRFPLLPGVIDTYVLSSFLFYFAVLLGSFVMLAHIFIFFDLLSDVVSRSIPMNRVMTYHVFLTPKLLYDSAPMSVLVAVLITFGLLSKNNEVIAMKACGVSLYRLAVPIVASSFLLSGGLFAFDHYYIPEANRIQDGILNQIKGRPSQTTLRPDRNFIRGEGSRMYYYKYFDTERKLMVGVNIYELDPATFHLKKHISAESARWEPSLEAWVFQNGWSREFQGARATKFNAYTVATFTEINEPPSYFLREVLQEKQLNFLDLEQYIRGLQQSGIDTVRLEVQLHKKFSVPLFALIMALISVPFAFLAGSRGAMSGVGISLSVAIAYWAVSRLFEEIGNVNQLAPPLAAWAPDAVFAFAGLYLFTRMRT